MAAETETTRSAPRLRRAFAKGVVVCVLALAALGVAVKVAGTGVHRPEGAAERWLAAVSDTTRNGVRSEARSRAEKIGALAIADPLLPAAASADGKAAFPDLEVGKATVTGATARVPYRLHQYAASGDAPVKDGVIVLAKRDGEWRVTALAGRRPGAEKVPSEGGAPPSSAPVGLWVAALLAGVVVTAGASLLVRWAGRGAARVEGTGTVTHSPAVG